MGIFRSNKNVVRDVGLEFALTDLVLCCNGEPGAVAVAAFAGDEAGVLEMGEDSLDGGV